MKHRFSIIISASALVILVLVQLYNISVTFETKLDQFNTRYSTLVKSALYEYESTQSNFNSDSIFMLFDLYSEELIYSFQDTPSGEIMDSRANPFSMA